MFIAGLLFWVFISRAILFLVIISPALLRLVIISPVILLLLFLVFISPAIISPALLRLVILPVILLISPAIISPALLRLVIISPVILLILLLVFISPALLFLVTVLGIGCTLLMAGNFPGVLFRVTLAWILGVDFSARFDVGLRACIIGGASVMRGTVTMGDSSITLCSSALTLCSSALTLCCARGVATDAWGVRMCFIFTCNFLISALPLAVVPALVVTSASSSVSSRRCCCGVRFGTWQCCGNSSDDPDILYALVSGTKYRSHR
jgi:hypothetical protein